MKVEAPDGWVPVTAECQTNPDLFFSDDDASKSIAKGVCSSCPVRVACKKTAFENREKHGIWGGVDMSTARLPKLDTTYCRSGKHKLPEVRDNNQCKECRDETQKAYQLRAARDQTPGYLRKLENAKKRKNSNRSRHKNVLGGKCKEGHLLETEGKDFFVRNTDKALVCKKCIHKPKNPLGLGGLNSGSRNHG
jgi:hypothetical protein